MVSLGLENATADLLAAEGAYLDVGGVQLLLIGGRGKGAPGLVLPLDTLFDDRLALAHQLHQLLAGEGLEVQGLSAYRRQRLKLALRALDGRLAGAGYREIARGLFPRLVGRDREPSEPVIGRAIRAVRYGARLMNGGYLDLLRPERRARRPSRKRS